MCDEQCSRCYFRGSCDKQDSIDYDEDNPYKSNREETNYGHYSKYDYDDDEWD